MRQRALPDPPHRLRHHREHSRGEPGEQGGDHRGGAERDVDPRQGQQRDKSGQHEQPARDQTSPGAIEQPPDVDRELLALRTG
jgi:hypothetical protein